MEDNPATACVAGDDHASACETREGGLDPAPSPWGGVSAHASGRFIVTTAAGAASGAARETVVGETAPGGEAAAAPLPAVSAVSVPSEDQNAIDCRVYGHPRYALYAFLNHLNAIEPGLFDAVKAIVATRPAFYPDEHRALDFLNHIEFGPTGYSRRAWKWGRRVAKLVEVDKGRRPGVGPMPWKTERLLRQYCGPSRGNRLAPKLLPVAQCCAAGWSRCLNTCIGDKKRRKVVLGRIMMASSVLFLLIDAADIIVDLVFVSRLADEGFTGYAVLLTASVLLVLPIEILMKHMLFQKAFELDITTADPDRQRIYLLFLAISELAIFLMEDTTTILIWFLSGTFDHSPASNANLYLTVVSGIVAAYGVAYPSISMAYGNGHGLRRKWKEDWARYQSAKRISDRAAIQHFRTQVALTVFAVIMFIATEALIVFWSWVAVDRVTNDETQYTTDDSVRNGMLVAYLMSWLVCLAAMWTFFWIIEEPELPDFWQPVYRFVKRWMPSFCRWPKKKLTAT